jgi:hypothetical protein
VRYHVRSGDHEITRYDWSEYLGNFVHLSQFFWSLCPHLRILMSEALEQTIHSLQRMWESSPQV